MAIVVDLETVAVAGVKTEPVTAPANYKDEAKIVAYVKEKQAEQITRAALYPWTARIVALGWCEEGEDIERVTICDSDAAEATALREFWGRAVDTRGAVTPLVTFAGRTFDLPVMLARSRMLGVKAPILDLRKYGNSHPDLLKILTFDYEQPPRSLKWFAELFGLDVSDAFGGKEIAQLYEDQNFDAIKSHCASDVRLTRLLAEKLNVLKAPVRVAA